MSSQYILYYILYPTKSTELKLEKENHSSEKYIFQLIVPLLPVVEALRPIALTSIFF